MQITLIKKDTGEVVFSMNMENCNNAILHKDYELINNPHDFIDIDGKIYVNLKYIIDLRKNSGEIEDDK